MDNVSIIVPVFNIDAYICKCLDSIINQSYEKIEVILIDDGSTDNSLQICDEYARKDSRIKVIHKQNEGLVCARKTGLQYASSEYIAYVDGDDWIEPNMIERLYNTMIDEDVDIVMCGRFEDTGDTHRQVCHGIDAGRYNKDELIERVYPHMIVNGDFFEWGIFPSVWDKLFRREFLEEYQMEVDDSLTMGEDAAVTYPALLNANSIYILNECLYHYRQSTNSMVKQTVDYEIQRKRFKTLYKSVNLTFDRFSKIFDLRDQWRDYLLFLMVPRFEALYKDVEKLDYLFPFSKVKKGNDIIIYGMGTYGQLLYRFVTNTGFCKVIACADKNYKELIKQGLDVISPDDISLYNCKDIVIANSFAKVRRAIFDDLLKKYPERHLHIMDEELIKADKSLRAFGLMD